MGSDGCGSLAVSFRFGERSKNFDSYAMLSVCRRAATTQLVVLWSTQEGNADVYGKVLRTSDHHSPVVNRSSTEISKYIPTLTPPSGMEESSSACALKIQPNRPVQRLLRYRLIKKAVT